MELEVRLGFSRGSSSVVTLSEPFFEVKVLSF